ncbi:MAG: M23 family metallopeptidase [Anaerolineae bacterium]|nr:M23 family metallopeptidase [Anaerolineae bacterium]
MGYSSRRGGRIIPVLIVLGVLAAAIFQWGRDIYRFVSGQDILDDLSSELALALPTATPVVAPAGSLVVTAGPDGGEPVQGENEIAPDGFPVRARPHVVKYTVKEGDALFLIAERFNLDPNTIFWSNTETLQDNVHLLHVGVQLYLLPTDGVYHLSDGVQSVAEIAAQYGVSAGDILYSDYNQLGQHDSSYVPPTGLRIVVPGGRRAYISWQAPIRTGTQSGAANPEGTLHPGSCRERYSGTGSASQFQNPLGALAYRVTNGFAPYHPGVDLAAELNTPIYAAETGVVVFAGWHRDGYGELIIIDHGEGWTTYYGHLSSRFVGCGDQVSKGQYIAQMGMTGNATGIHLHFEVRDADAPQNPYNYITIRDERSNFQ